jgi:hypothetical protein
LDGSILSFAARVKSTEKVCIEPGSKAQGLKPDSFSVDYAALKRRSCTVVQG